MSSRRSKNTNNQSNDVFYLGDNELDSFFRWDELIASVETEEKLIFLVKKLQTVAPHILWRISWREHDLGVYPVLVVPEEHFNEAEFILGLWEKGENLDNYCIEWMYPELYAVVDGKAVLRREVTTFINFAKEFIQLLREGARYDFGELLLRLLKLLPQLYVGALNLPDVVGDDSLEDDFASQLELDLNHFNREKLPEGWPNFGKFERYYSIEVPYYLEEEQEKKITIEERSLSKDLWELYNILGIGLVFFGPGKTEGKSDLLERQSAAVAYWRNEFDWTYGWGYRLPQILSALHFMLSRSNK